MRSVVNRNVVMQRIPVLTSTLKFSKANLKLHVARIHQNICTVEKSNLI
jgi:hypothetical protein